MAPVLAGLEAQAVVAALTTIASIKPQNWAVPNPSRLAQGAPEALKTQAAQAAATPRSVQLQRDNFKLEAALAGLVVTAPMLEAQAVHLLPLLVSAAVVAGTKLLVIRADLVVLEAAHQQS